MSRLTDILHDEIDAQEELRERAAKILEELRADVPKLAKEIDSIEDIFEILAALFGNELADLTTEAVRTGYEFAARRAGDEG